MTQHIKHIEPPHISDYALMRTLITRLWQIYDTSGVSMGRSLRAGLLESLVFTLPQPEELESSDIYQVDTHTLLSEAKRRIEIMKSCTVAAQLVLFLDLPYLPDEVFACLIFRAMAVWYEKDERTHEHPLLFEKSIVDTLYACMRGPAVLDQFTQAGFSYVPLAIINEGYDRRRLVSQMETRMSRW